MPAEPTTLKGVRTRQHLLDAARRVFAGQGFVKARMSDVAAEAGMSLGGLYRYFSDKEHVFRALVSDIHEDLYASSRPTDHAFGEAPFEALREANLGYLRHYREHRDVMRTLVEAAAVEPTFRELWWKMRSRHVERFAQAMREEFGVSDLDGIDTLVAADAMACLVEQVAYVWYGNAEIHDRTVELEDAAEVVTRAWYRLFFADGHDGATAGG